MKKYSYSLTASYLSGDSLQDRVISEFYVDFPVCENVVLDVFKYQMVHFLNELDSKEIHFTIDIINPEDD